MRGTPGNKPAVNKDRHTGLCPADGNSTWVEPPVAVCSLDFVGRYVCREPQSDSSDSKLSPALRSHIRVSLSQR